MNRGARRAPIFRIDDDCRGFIDVLGDTVERFEMELHAFSLMPNHYHLLVRSRQGNLSRCMQHLNGTYTQWLNARHRWDGPVFRGRFKSQLIEDEEHLRILLAYIHLNPVSANLIRKVDDEGWTSYRMYMNEEPRPAWLCTTFFVKLFGGRKRLHAFVESFRLGRREYPDDFNPDTGLFGKKAIEKQSQRVMSKKKRSGQGARNRPVEETLERIQRMTGADLGELRRVERGPGANPPRRFAIWALCRGAGISQREVAQLLNVSYYQVGRVLGYLRKKGAEGTIKEWMEKWIAEES
ncbi:MAG: transposase [Deltaproteobacteria bacterium]|nr:transposase [Deltaproteobacteria bacterium]